MITDPDYKLASVRSPTLKVYKLEGKIFTSRQEICNFYQVGVKTVNRWIRNSNMNGTILRTERILRDEFENYTGRSLKSRS